MDKINLDFRLLDVSLELHALEEYLETMEKQINHIAASEKLILEAAIRKQNITPDDPEWQGRSPRFSCLSKTSSSDTNIGTQTESPHYHCINSDRASA